MTASKAQFAEPFPPPAVLADALGRGGPSLRVPISLSVGTSIWGMPGVSKSPVLMRLPQIETKVKI